MAKTFLAIIALLAVSLFLVSDPTNSANLSTRAIPGTAMLSAALFMVGLALWIRD